MLWQTVTDYYCAKFQVILIRSFHFIMLTYATTCSHHDKVIAISTFHTAYYIVVADNK